MASECAVPPLRIRVGRTELLQQTRRLGDDNPAKKCQVIFRQIPRLTSRIYFITSLRKRLGPCLRFFPHTSSHIHPKKKVCWSFILSNAVSALDLAGNLLNVEYIIMTLFAASVCGLYLVSVSILRVTFNPDEYTQIEHRLGSLEIKKNRRRQFLIYSGIRA